MKDKQAIQAFMQQNYTWLTEWLTNVYVDKYSQDNMQIFYVEALPSMIDTINTIEYSIIEQLLIGERKEIKESKGRVFLFNGFFKAIGRMPTQHDTVIIKARRWMEVSPIPQTVLISDISGQLKPTLGLVCEFLPIYIISKDAT